MVRGGTNVATVCSHQLCPWQPLIRSSARLKTFEPNVILVDIATDGTSAALRAIELLHQEFPDSAVFAIGSMAHSQ